MFGAGLLLGIMVGLFLPKFFAGGSQAPPPPPPLAAKNINVDETVNRLRAMLGKDPGNYQAWVELGNTYYDANQPSRAVEAYVKALAIDGSSPDVHTDLGNMYRALGRPQDAVAEYRKAREVSPQHVQSRMNLGVTLLYDLKDYQGATEAWEDYLRVQPTGEQADQVRSQLEGLRKMASQIDESKKTGKPLQKPGSGTPQGGGMSLPPMEGAQ
jgi:cytochrome c-type biogenesis protein CcmH/NrfG